MKMKMKMKKFVWSLVALTLSAAVAILVIAIRNNLIPWEQVESALAKGFAALVGLALVTGATLPLSYRGRRVKRVRGLITFGPLTHTERRHNWRLWKFSFALLVIETTGIAIWQIFDHGDPVMTTWSLGALAMGYVICIPLRRPTELEPIKPPQTPSQMFWAVGDPAGAMVVEG